PEWHAKWDCGNGECDQPQCKDGFSDCNKDLDQSPPWDMSTNGCETLLGTDANCSECGDECTNGEFCSLFAGRCVCPCGAPCWGDASKGDPDNCGACNIRCAGAAGGALHDTGYCDQGVCRSGCEKDWADCDDNPGCETNLL